MVSMKPIDPERLERRRAANRASYQRNRAKVLEKHRQWRRNNPERMKQLNAEWYAKNHLAALASRKKYRDANRETMRLLIRAWYQKNREVVLAEARFQTTGCTQEMFDKLFKLQGGLCAICLRPPKRGSLNADHCHSSLVVRGLLCGPCNRMLGLAEDNIQTLESAIQYLKLHPAAQLRS